jgi:hypothetical protein
VYRRTESGWVADMYSPEDTVTFSPGGTALNFEMADLYEGSGVA